MREIRVRVLIAFNGMRKGDTGMAPDTEIVRGYIRSGLMEAIEGGERTTGQSGPETGDTRSVPEGAAGGVPASGQPGKGARSRRHRKAKGVDQSGPAPTADAPPVGQGGD